MTDIKKGLAGVTVDETAVSKVNPETNSLLYRGYPVQDSPRPSLSRRWRTCCVNGELPDAAQLAALRRTERGHRALSDDVRAAIDLLPTSAHPMDEVRTAVSVIGARETAGISNVMDAVGTPEENLERSVRLWAQLPAVVAYGQRRRRGQELIDPRDDLDYAANFLWMTFGEEICTPTEGLSLSKPPGCGAGPSTSSGSSGASSGPQGPGCGLRGPRPFPTPSSSTRSTGR